MVDFVVDFESLYSDSITYFDEGVEELLVCEYANDEVE
jgi:hypothetical protein